MITYYGTEVEVETARADGGFDYREFCVECEVTVDDEDAELKSILGVEEIFRSSGVIVRSVELTVEQLPEAGLKKIRDELMDDDLRLSLYEEAATWDRDEAIDLDRKIAREDALSGRRGSD